MPNASDLNEFFTELEGLALRTEQGSFLRLEDVRRLIDKKQDAEVGFEQPQPKTVEQAREAIKRDPAIMAAFADMDPDPGSSIPVSSLQSASRP